MAVNLNLKINHRDTVVDITQIPKPSTKTQKIFEELQFQPTDAMTTLHDRCSKLKTTAARLEHAKDFSTRNKIGALLLAAFAIAVIALTTVGIVAAKGPIGMICIGLLGLLAYRGANRLAFQSYKDNPGVEKSEFHKILAPFIGVHKAFNKVSQFTRSELDQRLSVQSKFESLVTFFTTHQEDLGKKIDKKLTESTSELAKMKKRDVRTPAGENEIAQKITDLRYARADLEAFYNYYAQFKA